MATLTPEVSESYVENSEAVAASKTEQLFYETAATFYFGNRGPRSWQAGPMSWVRTGLAGAGVSGRADKKMLSKPFCLEVEI
jgi:hypothetical protein